VLRIPPLIRRRHQALLRCTLGSCHAQPPVDQPGHAGLGCLLARAEGVQGSRCCLEHTHLTGPSAASRRQR
jgi:hypothetical protein